MEITPEQVLEFAKAKGKVNIGLVQQHFNCRFAIACKLYDSLDEKYKLKKEDYLSPKETEKRINEFLG